MTKLAVFDICDTLYRSNTTFDFIKYFNKGKKIKLYYVMMLRTLPFKALNRLSLCFLNFDLIKFLLIMTLRNHSKEEIEMKAELFYDEVLINLRLISVHEILKEYKEKGYTIALLSATIDPVASVIMKRVNADLTYSSQLRFKDNICQGVLSKDLYGNKKGVLDSDIDFFITDNFNDLDIVKDSLSYKIVLKEKSLQYWRQNLGQHFEYIMVD